MLDGCQAAARPEDGGYDARKGERKRDQSQPQKPWQVDVDPIL